MKSPESVLKADEEFQIGLRAASEVASDIRAREECLMRAVEALDREESLLSTIDVNMFEIVMSDIQWKNALIDSIPPDVSEDQLRAMHVLVKTRPFISDILT
jgi:hypothetical protein